MKTLIIRTPVEIFCVDGNDAIEAAQNAGHLLDTQVLFCTSMMGQDGLTWETVTQVQLDLSQHHAATKTPAAKIEPAKQVDGNSKLDDVLIDLHCKLQEVSTAIQEIETPAPEMAGVDWGHAGDAAQLVNSLIEAVNQYNGHAA